MASVSDELESFYKYAGVRLRTGSAADESLDELYAEWRANNPSAQSLEIDVRAVRAALSDIDAGNIGRPVGEFIAEFRRDNGLTT
ncbi:MAG: hypothetical protein U0805_21780 [Pirellulales bacterium]